MSMVNLLDDIFQLEEDLRNEPQCKGTYFRYTENAYCSNDKFVFQKQISLLKKMSCPGCSKCDWLLDDAKEGIVDSGDSFFEFDPTLKHNDVVTLELVIDGRDWDMGYVDEWHLKVVKADQL